MLINCYYYAPHNHSLLETHLRADMEHIASLGALAVSVCVQEDQLVNWHQQRLANVVAAAHSAGLAIHAVPNRWCGLTAGWLDGFSAWTVGHPETFMPQQPGSSDPAHAAVCEHFQENLQRMLERFDFDGLIWDEPTPAQADVIEFLDERSLFAKSVRPDIVVSLFAEAAGLHLPETLAATQHIDYLGADGHVRSEDHQMHRMKNTIFTTHARFSPVLKAAGKKTVFLLEAQRHRDEDLEDYLATIDEAFSLPMDQMMFYYSAHEMSSAAETPFNEATWAAVRQRA